MADEVIESKIVKFNHVKGKAPGIQLENGFWYNATEKTEKYVAALKDKVGCKVQIQHVDRMISFVKVLEENDKKVSVGMGDSIASQTPGAPYNVLRKPFVNHEDDTNDMIIRQTCVKAAAELMKCKSLEDEEFDFYDTCKRMEKYIHTGE